MNSLTKMKNTAHPNQYIYHTRDVCPPEIHFKINSGTIEDIRFVGGGCPGNAQLVSRLLEGKPVADVLESLAGIDCRNGTSCSDQLASALHEVNRGQLHPAESFRVAVDASPKRRIGLVGALEGKADIVEKLIQHMQASNVESFYWFGNLTGDSIQNQDVIKALRKQKITALQGERDWQYARSREEKGMPPLNQSQRDWLFRLPQVLSFQLAQKKGMAFFGDFIQSLPDYSDFEPFALEINMVCGLADFMRDETVFPALEAMLPQIQTDIVLFSQTQKWSHWQMGGKDFISVGPASDDEKIYWGILEAHSKTTRFKVMDAEV
jgi:uncharacterized protein (TIGR03905 family)